MSAYIPLSAVTPMSPKMRRLYETMKPTKKRSTGKYKAAAELASMIEARWHAAGYLMVEAYASEDEFGNPIVVSNLVGGLPPGDVIQYVR